MQKKVYIAAPACTASGGPELLHQLCFKLNKFGFQAKMLYYGYGKEITNVTNPIHPHYEVYHNPFTISFEEVNSEDAIVIIPELAIDLINHINLCQQVIWWLSVDNYYGYVEIMYKRNIRNDENVDVFNLRNKNILHMVQSYYAKDFALQRLGISEEKVFYLSDYLRKDFEVKNNSRNRKNYCLYNPQKGFDKILQIMSKNPKITWIPIANMTPKQVADLMSESKVYVDFGNHPGKDRIPREAAMRGCCIITNKAGSAAYSQDVSIPEKYKFEDIYKSSEEIVELIEDVYQDFEKHKKEFDNYRENIIMEERLFDEDVLKIFGELTK
jgi:predicted nuclease of predicted toxin-antitoxin system